MGRYEQAITSLGDGAVCSPEFRSRRSILLTLEELTKQWAIARRPQGLSGITLISLTIAIYVPTRPERKIKGQIPTVCLRADFSLPTASLRCFGSVYFTRTMTGLLADECAMPA